MSVRGRIGKLERQLEPDEAHRISVEILAEGQEFEHPEGGYINDRGEFVKVMNVSIGGIDPATDI